MCNIDILVLDDGDIEPKFFYKCLHKIVLASIQ